MNESGQHPVSLIRRMGTLADGTRLRLLRLLERQELGVAELCDVVQMPQSTVSRHLKVLADEGWVRSRRNGTTNLYQMRLEEFDDQARSLWTLARSQTDGWAALQQDHVRLVRCLCQRKQQAAAFFAGAASEWDKTRRELYGNSFSGDAMLAMVPGDWQVADLGCGTGTIAAVLARFVRRVVAVDNSTAMLQAAREHTRDLPNVELRQGDLEAIPVADSTCDAALLVLVLAYLPDPPLVLDEMHRILKPGGRAVVVDLLRHDREDFRRQMGQECLGFEPDQLRGMLGRAGFRRTECVPLPPEKDAKGPALLLASGLKDDS